MGLKLKLDAGSPIRAVLIPLCGGSKMKKHPECKQLQHMSIVTPESQQVMAHSNAIL